MRIAFLWDCIDPENNNLIKNLAPIPLFGLGPSAFRKEGERESDERSFHASFACVPLFGDGENENMMFLKLSERLNLCNESLPFPSFLVRNP